MSENDSSIRWERDGEGVVTLTMDDPQASANTMNERFIRSLADTVDRLYTERDDITGVILTSAKKTFFAGGNLDDLLRAGPADRDRLLATVTTVKRQLRRLETLDRPVVAAINGAALGGGLELALACHYRVVLDSPSVRLGFPEVTLGLLPGAGGVVRSVRLLGLAEALLKLLLQGQRLRPAAAVTLGIADEVAATPAEVITRARALLAAHPDAAARYDRPGYRVPGGTPSTPALAAMLPAFPATLRKQLKGAHYPAPHHILCAAVEGLSVDLETAFEIEGRYFVDLATGQPAKNMIQAFWFDLNRVNGGGSRPADVPAVTAARVGVLGAGMMGAGIAHVCATAGLQVVLKDVDQAAAQRGVDRIAGLLDRDVERGRSTPERRAEILARITPAADAAALAGVDAVIEAVFEDSELKARVFAEVTPVVGASALLASNTSTLPITELAAEVSRPADFIGMHFFSPVERMPLVELIVGRQTSPQTLARAYDLVRQIGKTPIVVNDSRGFFTSRVFGTMVLEGAALLGAGLAPMSVERAALQAGFPAGPLTLLDEVTLTLPLKIREEARRAAEREGTPVADHPGVAVVERMVNEFGRTGKASGRGFFDWGTDGGKQVWPELAGHFSAPGAAEVPWSDVGERLLFAMAVESVRCLDEGVLTSVEDANIGSIMGIGFPPIYGGVLQYVDQYPGGVAGFTARADELADRYGERFRPTASLRARSAGGGSLRPAA